MNGVSCLEVARKRGAMLYGYSDLWHVVSLIPGLVQLHCVSGPV